MTASHSEPLETCAKLNAYTLLTLTGDSLQSPETRVWGNRRFATVIVARRDEQLDWRFHLGFGHRFVFDDRSPHQYYCIGFSFSKGVRGKHLIAVEISVGDEGGLLLGKKRQRDDADNVEGGSTNVRVFPTSNLVPFGIPRVAGNILSATNDIRSRFFTAVRNLFAKGSALPAISSFSDAQVCFLFSL